ncbi:uncharacterized protein C8Q71DRAFT_572658 [Rhodofomes roseus]|uniref:Transmembrane protein n=1 Tax=Rhodofomes roseus TaxID=34475 RepID=A0ABQ8KJ22_9APHY|nr:uncharacterized protein C8Q71DRAFT_572658 [Rhodofomes roseus]KAH9838010.1 hypothetical protein C8Q71DRAFT_572658 [Rhodofomes roseus]
MLYQPYNISFDDKSPLLWYTPLRGIDNNGSSFCGTSRPEYDCWYAINTTGRASSYTTSVLGATVSLQWTGTAVWLYGEANATYQIGRTWNGSTILGEGTGTGGGVLYAESGVSYGVHTVVLTVLEGPVTIIGATITVGMGEPGSTIKATNVSSIIEDIPAINPFFTVNSNDSWQGDLAFGPNGELETIILTATQGDSVTFVVNSSVTFAVYGANDPSQGTYLVDIDPPVPNNPNTSTAYQLNATAPWVVIEEIRYVATGLNRTQNYSVTLTNAESGREFNVGRVILFDAISPASSSSALPSQTMTSSSSSNAGGPAATSHDLRRGTVAGIVVSVGTIAGALLIAIFLFARFRARGIYTHGTAPNLVEPKLGEQATSRTGEEPQDTEPQSDAPAMVVHPYTKTYATSGKSVPVETEDPSSQVAESSRRRPTEMPSSSAPGLENHDSSSPPVIPAVASSPSLLLPTHDEDAGPVPDLLPPMYNPDWSIAEELDTPDED